MKKDIDWSKFDLLATQGVPQRRIAEMCGISRMWVMKKIRERGVYLKWKLANQQFRKRNNKWPKETKHKAMIFSLLDEAEKLGYKVTKSESVRECTIEGLQLSIHQPKKHYVTNKRYPDLIYYIIGTATPNRLDVAFLPCGKKVFRLPQIPHRKFWNINVRAEENKGEEWPTRYQFRIAKSEMRKAKEREKNRENDLTNDDV